MKRTLSLSSVLFLLSALPALAANPKPKPNHSLFQPVDAVDTYLKKKRKSKSAKKIYDGFRALQQGNTSAAREAGEALKSEKLFADYGLVLQALSHLQDGDSYLKEKKFVSATTAARRAKELFLQIESLHPYSPVIDRLAEEIGRSEILLARSYFGRQMWVSARNTYDRAFQRFKRESILSLENDVFSEYAQVCSKKKAWLCSAWARRIIDLFPPRSKEVNPLEKHLPKMVSFGNPTVSKSKRKRSYRASDKDAAAFDEGFQFYVEESYGDAIDKFQEMLKEYPDSEELNRALYWLGKAYQKKGKNKEARQTFNRVVNEYPLTYYGLLASLETGIDIEEMIDGTLPEAAVTDPALRPIELFRLKRAEHFIAEGAHQLASEELRGLSARDDLSDPFLVYLATLQNEVGNHLGSFIAIGSLIRREHESALTSYGLRIIFPKAHFETIEKQSKALELDPLLVLSLVKQESAFDAEAVSWAGATGLMQLMPMTARDVDRNVRLADLRTPEVNVRLGTTYLKRVLNRFDGNLAMSLAGYNAGPNAVARWVREGRAKHGMLEFIEMIPYKETRGYVSSIIRNYFWYSRRLKGEKNVKLGFFWANKSPTESM